MLSRIERGIVSASLTTLARVAEALDAEVEELVATRVLTESFVVMPSGSGSTRQLLHGTAALRQVRQLSARTIILRTSVLTLVQTRRANQRPSARVPSPPSCLPEGPLVSSEIERSSLPVGTAFLLTVARHYGALPGGVQLPNC